VRVGEVRGGWVGGGRGRGGEGRGGEERGGGGGGEERRKQIKRGRVSKLQNNDLRLFRFVVSHFITIHKLHYFDISGTATN